MAKKTEVKAEVEVVEVAPIVQTEESAAKVAFRAHIAAYAEANPTKYELKKAELERQLANIK